MVGSKAILDPERYRIVIYCMTISILGHFKSKEISIVAAYLRKFYSLLHVEVVCQ